MCIQASDNSNLKVWRPEDTAQPTPTQPGSNQLYRPDIVETIEAKIKEMDAELKELSLDIHGIHHIGYYLFDPILSSTVAHPELGYEE
jgi:hypothetical protein